MIAIIITWHHSKRPCLDSSSGLAGSSIRPVQPTDFRASRCRHWQHAKLSNRRRCRNCAVTSIPCLVTGVESKSSWKKSISNWCCPFAAKITFREASVCKQMKEMHFCIGIEGHHDCVLLDLDLSYWVAWHPGFRLRNGSVNFDWPGWPADARWPHKYTWIWLNRIITYHVDY